MIQSHFLDAGQNRIFSIARILERIAIGIKDSEYVAGPLTYHPNISILYTPRKIHSLSSIRTNSTLFFLLLSFAKNIQQQIIKAVVNYLVSTDDVFRPVACYFCSRRHCLNCSASSVGRLIKIKQDLIRPLSLGEKQRSTRSR